MEIDHKGTLPSAAKVHTFDALLQMVREYGVADVISASQDGLSAELLTSLADHFGISPQEAQRMAGLSSTTVDRKIRKKVMLSPATSEKLIRIAELEVMAVDVIGEDAARHWLETPNIALGHKSPLASIADHDTSAALQVLGAIRYGGAA